MPDLEEKSSSHEDESKAENKISEENEYKQTKSNNNLSVRPDKKPSYPSMIMDNEELVRKELSKKMSIFSRKPSGDLTNDKVVSELMTLLKGLGKNENFVFYFKEKAERHRKFGVDRTIESGKCTFEGREGYSVV